MCHIDNAFLFSFYRSLSFSIAQLHVFSLFISFTTTTASYFSSVVVVVVELLFLSSVTMADYNFI